MCSLVYRNLLNPDKSIPNLFRFSGVYPQDTIKLFKVLQEAKLSGEQITLDASKMRLRFPPQFRKNLSLEVLKASTQKGYVEINYLIVRSQNWNAISTFKREFFMPFNKALEILNDFPPEHWHKNFRLALGVLKEMGKEVLFGKKDFFKSYEMASWDSPFTTSGCEPGLGYEIVAAIGKIIAEGKFPSELGTRELPLDLEIFADFYPQSFLWLEPEQKIESIASLLNYLVNSRGKPPKFFMIG